MKQRLNNLAIVLLIILMMSAGCDPYEDYIEDFDFSIAYFSTQKPLRTIVAYDAMSFKVGVALGGKRTNETSEVIGFELDPSLLDNPEVVGNNQFELLPDNYYSIDGEEMVVPVGEFIGDVTVNLNTELFTTDSLSSQNHYAIPLRITSSTTDSVAIGSFDESGNSIVTAKDYTVVVVKYISPLQGTYYKQGVQKELDAEGVELNEVVYNDPDLVKNPTWELLTVNRYSVSTSGVGSFDDGSLVLSLDRATNQASITTESAAITELSGKGSYDPEQGVFQLDYTFQRQGRSYAVSERLTIRQAPEKDLRFEEWQ